MNDAPMQANVGATITNDYVSRTLKVVPIFEHEFDTLTQGGRSASLWSSAGSALLSFAAGILVNASFQTNFTLLATNMTKYVAPSLAVLSLICFALSARAWIKTNAVAKDLKSKFK